VAARSMTARRSSALRRVRFDNLTIPR
jgi:hypothetical protein